MIDARRDTVWNHAAVYVAGTVFAKTLSIITFPIIISHLPIADYGVWSVVVSIPPFMALLAIFGQDDAVGAFICQDFCEVRKRELISQSFALQLFTICSMVVVLWAFSPLVCRHIFSDDYQDNTFIFRLSLLQAPLFVAYNFSLNILKWTKRRNALVFLTSGYSLLYTCLVVVGLVVYGSGLAGLVLINVLTYFVFCVFGLRLVSGHLLLGSLKPRFSELSRFATFIGLAIILTSVLPIVERVLVGKTLGPMALGVFAITLQVAVLVTFISEAFHMAWGPFALISKGEALVVTKVNSIFLKYSGYMLSLVCVLCAIFMVLMKYITSEAANESNHILFFVALGLSVHSISKILETSFYAHSVPGLVIFGVLARFFLTLLGLFVFAPKYGLFSVAISDCVGGAIQLFIASILSKKFVPEMKWPFLHLAGVLMMCLAGGVISTYIYEIYGEWYSAVSYFVVAVGLVMTVHAALDQEKYRLPCHSID